MRRFQTPWFLLLLILLPVFGLGSCSEDSAGEGEGEEGEEGEGEEGEGEEGEGEEGEGEEGEGEEGEGEEGEGEEGEGEEGEGEGEEGEGEGEEGEGEGEEGEGEGEEGEGEGEEGEGEGEEGEGEEGEGEEGEGEGEEGEGEPPEGPPRFAFPIHEEDRELIDTNLVFGVDHDPEEHSGTGRMTCTNYAGESFPRCYDGHDGSDYLLRGGFRVMDRGSGRVVAAAGGVVTRTVDGNYDRCHGDVSSLDVSCDGHPMHANLVRIRHALGWETIYAHFKSGSLLVEEGQEVDCGEVLGLIGSSGYSSSPHLHFEVEDPEGQVWDPYAGEFSQEQSLWLVQDAGDGLPGQACDPVWD